MRRLSPLIFLLLVVQPGCGLEFDAPQGKSSSPTPDLLLGFDAGDLPGDQDDSEVVETGSLVFDFENPEEYTVRTPGVVTSGSASMESFQRLPANEDAASAAGIYPLDPPDAIPLDSSDSDLQALWTFDDPAYDGSNDEISDGSGNGLTGKANAPFTQPLAKYGRGLQLGFRGTAEFDDDNALETVPGRSVTLWFDDQINGGTAGQLFGKRSPGNFDRNRSEIFDASAIAAPGGYNGGTFDGRFVYFAPRGDPAAPHGTILRFDTQGALSDIGSWATFTSTGLFPSQTYAGTVFDGQYVYFVPLTDGTGNPSTAILRYDTALPFSNSTSWTMFNFGSRVPGAAGFLGGTFDGRYVYLTPFQDHSIVVRYDTSAEFNNPLSWTSFDLSDLSADLVGYAGATFDGRYVYFAPLGLGVGNAHGNVVRLDTEGDFQQSASWSTFDTTALGALAQGFSNIITDGEYLYLVPYHNGVAIHDLVVRYELAAPFEDASSWSGINIGRPGYVDAAFDGRNLYFLGYEPVFGQDDVLRYDTSLAFASGSFEHVDMLDRGFAGMIFDGRYLYFVPDQDGAYHARVLRYDTDDEASGLAIWSSLGWQSGTSGGPVGVTATLSTDQGHWVAASPVTLSDRLLHLAAATWDGSQLSVYLDGVLQSSTVTQGMAVANNDPVVLGTHYRGLLDDVATWNTTLDAATIAELFSQGRATDVSSGGNHGDIRATVTPTTSFSAGFGGALQFSRRGQINVSPDDRWRTTNGITTMAWVKRSLATPAPLPEYVIARWPSALTPIEERVDSWDISNTDPEGVGGFAGGVFDGEYIYLVPRGSDAVPSGTILRHALGAPGESWTGFDMTAAGFEGYEGAAFDGRYIYLAPAGNGSSSVVRYDTRAPFGAAESYLGFDLTGLPDVGMENVGFAGAFFDGEQLYFAPARNNQGAPHSTLIIYNTDQAFEDPASWTAIDLSDLLQVDVAGSRGFGYDGAHLYLLPGENASGAHGVVARHNLSLEISSDGSWTLFDVNDQVDNEAAHFGGAVFDGRYMYFAPGASSDPEAKTLARYDTAMAFDNPEAWQTRDLTTIDPGARGYRGAITDGRYIYLVPAENDAGAHGVLLRYDTRLPFGSKDAWVVLDLMSTFGAETAGYQGAIFDSRHIYLVPYQNSTALHGRLVRIDTRGDTSFVVGTGLGVQPGALSAAPPGPFVAAQTNQGVRFTHREEALDDGWHELSSRISNTETILYVDGSRAASVSQGTALEISTARITLGENYEGVLDDVAVYPTQLTDAIILSHSIQGFPVGVRGSVQTRMPASVAPITQYTGFAATEMSNPSTEMSYQLSVDGGMTWLYFDGEWTASGGSLVLSSDAVTVAENIVTLPTGDETIMLRVILQTDSSTESPRVDEVVIGWQ